MNIRSNPTIKQQLIQTNEHLRKSRRAHILNEKRFEVNIKSLLIDIHNLYTDIWNRISYVNIPFDKNIYPPEYVEFIDKTMLFIYSEFTNNMIPISEIKNNKTIYDTIIACYPSLKTFEQILLISENENLIYKSMTNIITNKIIPTDSIVQLLCNIAYSVCTERINYLNYEDLFEEIIFSSFDGNNIVLDCYGDLFVRSRYY